MDPDTGCDASAVSQFAAHWFYFWYRIIIPVLIYDSWLCWNHHAAVISDDITSPRRPHILALGTSSPHPSIAFHLLFTYFLPRFPSASSFATCGAPRCRSVKLRRVHCGCADLRPWPGLSHGTSWVIPTRDPILLCILLCDSPPNLRASESPSSSEGCSNDPQPFSSSCISPFSLNPLSSSFSSPLTVSALPPFPL